MWIWFILCRQELHSGLWNKSIQMKDKDGTQAKSSHSDVFVCCCVPVCSCYINIRWLWSTFTPRYILYFFLCSFPFLSLCRIRQQTEAIWLLPFCFSESPFLVSEPIYADILLVQKLYPKSVTLTSLLTDTFVTLFSESWN